MLAAVGVAVEGEAVFALLLNKDPDEGVLNGCAAVVDDSDFALKNELVDVAGAAVLNENGDVDVAEAVVVAAVIGAVLAAVLNENGFADVGVAGVVVETAALKKGAVGDFGIDVVDSDDDEGDCIEALLFNSPQFDMTTSF